MKRVFLCYFVCFICNLFVSKEILLISNNQIIFSFMNKIASLHKVIQSCRNAGFDIAVPFCGSDLDTS